MMLLASLFNEWMRGNGRAMGNLCSVGVHKNVPAEACGCGCGARRGGGQTSLLLERCFRFDVWLTDRRMCWPNIEYERFPTYSRVVRGVWALGRPCQRLSKASRISFKLSWSGARRLLVSIPVDSLFAQPL